MSVFSMIRGQMNLPQEKMLSLLLCIMGYVFLAMKINKGSSPVITDLLGRSQSGRETAVGLWSHNLRKVIYIKSVLHDYNMNYSTFNLESPGFHKRQRCHTHTTVQSCFYMGSSIQNTHNGHKSVTWPWGWDAGHLLWIHILICV